MTFSPDKPELPTDLICWCDTDKNQAAWLIYTSDEGDFYRNEGTWKEISSESDWQLDLDTLVPVYVTPALIPVYDKAEEENDNFFIEDVFKYKTADLGQE